MSKVGGRSKDGASIRDHEPDFTGMIVARCITRRCRQLGYHASYCPLLSKISTVPGVHPKDNNRG